MGAETLLYGRLPVLVHDIVFGFLSSCPARRCDARGRHHWRLAERVLKSLFARLAEFYLTAPF